MAEIQAASAPRSGKPRATKKAFRLDMTPMVDLAFLLLTFFMLTTTFSKPTVMEVAMPTKPEPQEPDASVSAKRALTLILGENGKVRYFFGLNEAAVNPAAPKPTLYTTDLSPNGLRQVLLSRQRQSPAPIVLIKTEAGAKYQHLVDALDEMNITDQKKYALVEMNRSDEELLKSRRW
ncbi:biopolymer transporter ExbD [Hymenobacter sp. HSC-4F20]|uniref:ExbD/TolR family protein n=1 Tax=Hymenobacter sp. HSC-4F20 TaxID=2864135 RepID=UPI001C72FACB|nr:biopolymer transporter ExbD [Hymenobacter sp. HSC-4F20]MBX0291583.1 biopolymer transporter ExbD [Hymenobacter sp. HSC-4F20]